MEALNNLGIDFKVMIAQIINFGILVFILVKFLYRPLLKALDDRRKKISDSLDKAKEIEQKSSEVELEVQAKRSEAKSEATAIISEAKSEADKARESMLKAAENEAADIKKTAREQMEIERQGLYADTKKRVSQLALLIVAKSLKEDLSDDFYKKNIDKALNEIEAKA
jgi:F-type H+-transporting ATPase subunit b